MSSHAQNIVNTNISDAASFSIHIIHRDKNYEINYNDFSNKSSYKEVIGLPHSFKITIDDILETDSVNALIEHINTRKTTEVINENNIFDLNFLSHLYGFYLLQAVTGPYLLSKIPVNRVFEAFERRKNVNGYVQSFSYYFTHNFDTFVHDPSFYTLPFNVIEQMLEFNVSELTVDDVVQFTINTYYVHGKKSLTLLEKANNCRSISEQKNQIQDPNQADAFKKQNSKTNLRNIFYKMIDSEDYNNNRRLSEASSINDMNNTDKDSSSFNLTNENDKNDDNSNDNFSVNSNIYSSTNNLIQTKKVKRGGKLLEKECSTASLIHLYATICNEKPYPYTQYILSILSKRKKVTTTNEVKQEVEELRYNISSIYIALLETTQGNKNAAYILLTSLFESGKIDFLTNKDIVNLYKNLSNIPPPQEQQQLPPQEKLRFSFSFGDIESNLKSDFDNRVLLKKFDWGAHGLYMLYRIYQEGLYGSSKDPAQAQVFLKRSVDRDYNEAIFKMASFIVMSPTFLAIREDKLEILKKAADLGNGDYQFAYASCLAERGDRFNDPVNAAHYFKLAMISGHPNARRNYERLQCNVFAATNKECNRIYSIAVSDRVDQLKVKLNMLRKTADCGYDPSIILYPTMLVDADCSPLNPDRPMDQEMQRREVCHYFMCAIKKSMKWCHSVLSLFLLRKLKNVDDLNNALKILSEGSSFGMYDSSVFYARLLLRILGRSYRQIGFAVSLLQQAASENYPPALLEISNSFLYGDEIGETYGADSRLAMDSLRQLYQMKEPIGSSRFLYILINDKTVPKQLTNARINELKGIVDSSFPPENSKTKNLNVKKKRGTYDCLPLWLYAKVMLEGKATSTDFKAAVTALKKADDFAPAMVLLVSLCFQFNGIVKPSFNIFNIPLFNSSLTNKSQSNSPAVPKNFDPSLLPLPSATSEIVERFVALADPTFMYRMGCMRLIEDEESERGFQLIRQSADAGSICGMMRYAMIRTEGSFRSKNEYEAIKMFRKSAQMGLDVAVLQYAHYAMKYKEIRQEAIQALQLIRGHDSTTAESSQNFVSNRKSCFVEGKKLRLALGKSLYFQGGSLLQESQFHLTSIIQQYENQTPQNESTENNASSFSISKEEYAEALFYFGKLLEKSAVNFTPSDPCVNNSLVHFLRSYSNGYKAAAESYVSLLMRVGEFNAAVDFLLDNLSCLTFSLYKIGSLTIYETPGVTTNIAESQAVDFIKLATLMDDVSQFPDAIWRYGTMLRDGFYVAKDEENALGCFYDAARLGCVNAIVAIGDFALKKAKKAFERSKSSQKPIEMLSISTQNRIVAAKCFENASRANSPTGSWCEALCLWNGIGREIDRPAAVLTLRKLADRGDRDAIYKLGKIAFNLSKSGKNQIPLLTTAIKMIASAAQLGHSTALWRLGLLILQGKVQKNTAFNILNNNCNFDFLNASSEKVAAELFKRSADGGNCRAASLFSLCLENGIGVDRNIELARSYASYNAKEMTE